MPEGIDLLNVNIPENPVDEEFEVAKLGNRMYTPIIQRRLDPRENLIIGLVETLTIQIVKVQMVTALKN